MSETSQIINEKECVMENKYVLAMYDVRGKQEFIFRTNKIKEMVGGSLVIRDLFNDYLYSVAKQVDRSGNKATTNGIFNEQDRPFTRNDFERHISSGYIGEVIYDGGGNFFVLYASKEAMVAVNKLFTLEVMREIGTLRVLCSYIESVNFDDYKGDEKKLRRVHRINENEETIGRPVNAIPLVELDPNTSMPIVQTAVGTLQGKNLPSRTTQESYAKLKKYTDVARNNSEYGEAVLDNLVKEKGEDSMLAVLFIDGNNMGAKVSNCLQAVGSDYESCIKALRDFSADIQSNYVDNPKTAIENKLKSKGTGSNLHPIVRMIVFAGDEMSFVCKAEDAWDAVQAYFEKLHDNEDPKDPRSSCAGIALFHSHAPYAEAYKIAEECCENGKKRMRKNEEKDTCYVDYQYCQGSLGMELDTIRNRETKNLISKPWLLSGQFGSQSIRDEQFTVEEVETVVEAFRLMNARSNVKDLVNSAKETIQAFDLEMMRIYAHLKENLKQNQLIKWLFKDEQYNNLSNLNGERRRKLVYDIGIVFDQWFR